MRCPSCGAEEPETTLMGGLIGIDRNRAWCGCGWEGIAQDAMTPDEAQTQVGLALKRFIGQRIEPTLFDLIREVLLPFVNRGERFFPPEAILTKAIENEDGVVETVQVTLDKALLEGRAAGELRACGIPIQDDVPDCATIKDGEWSWIEVDVVLKPEEGP